MGIEDPQDLIADLDQAIKAFQGRNPGGQGGFRRSFPGNSPGSVPETTRNSHDLQLWYVVLPGTGLFGVVVQPQSLNLWKHATQNQSVPQNVGVLVGECTHNMSHNTL